MSAFKDGRYPVKLDGKTYHMLVDLNVLDELDDKAGGFDNLSAYLDMKAKDIFKRLRWLLTLLINEGMDDGEPELSEKQIGKMIHTGNLGEIRSSMFKAFGVGLSGKTDAGAVVADESEGENEKNA